MIHQRITTALAAASFAVIALTASPAHATTTPDTMPPSTPQNPYAYAVSSSQINLSWATSTDDVGVTGYRVFRDSVWTGTSLVTNFADTGLSPATLYTYTVAAFDDAGNVSPQSASTSAMTQSAPAVFDFSLINSGNISLVQGMSGTNNITATLLSGTSKSVSFSASGLPSGATATFSPTSCNPSCTSALAIQTGASTPAGSYPITVVGTDGSIAHNTVFILTVTAPPSTDKFQNGDRVYVTTNKLNVRKTPGGKNVGFHKMGDQGTIIGGPTSANGYIWWNVDYDSAPDGWSAQDWLEKVTTAQNTGSSATVPAASGGTSSQLSSMASVLQSMQQLLAGPSTPDSSVLTSIAATLASVQTLISGIVAGR